MKREKQNEGGHTVHFDTPKARKETPDIVEDGS